MADKKKTLSKQDVALLNSKIGRRMLFKHREVDLEKVLEEIHHEHRIKELQTEMVKLQYHVIEQRKKVVLIFEGRDAAGKGGAIRRVTEHINPRHFKSVALDIPTVDEQQQWYFQRYVNRLPLPGEMVFFDRSWYNRAIVEPVNGFCTEKEYHIFMGQVNGFEKMLTQSDTYLIKFYFAIDKEEQARRFAEIMGDPLKQWKMTAVDKKAQALWDSTTAYEKAMFSITDTTTAPWMIIDANRKSLARIKVMEHILNTIPYD